MSEAQQFPFVPAWLDDAGLTQAEFRLYCHLCRRADNKTKIAWPSYDSMVQICGSSKMTIRRSLESLAERGLITNAGKPFGGSCRYQILAPIVPPQGQMDASNSTTRDTIAGAPIVPPQDCNSTTSLPPIVPPQVREGTPLKVLQERESNSIGELFTSPPSETIPSNDSKAETIYQEYPRKVSKPEAIAAIKKALKTISAEKLLEKVKTYASAIGWQERQFIPHPATWFNKRRWEDDPAEWVQPPSNGSRPAQPVTVDTTNRPSPAKTVPR
jgi:hypothetical protein